MSNKPCVSPFTFKLDDCLACSSCITDFKVKKIPSADDLRSSNFSFIISPHSKMNIFNHYKNHNVVSFDEFESILISFIKKVFIVDKIYDSSYIKNFLLEKVYLESEQGKLIINDCPGTCSYIERQGHHLLKYLSKTITQQQAIKCLINGKCVSVVQCYDKMMENNKDDTLLDYVITTFDFYKILIDEGFLSYKENIKCLDEEKCNINYHYGYLDYIINRKYGYNNTDYDINLHTKKDFSKLKTKKNVINLDTNIYNNIVINGKRNLLIDSFNLNKLSLEDSRYSYEVGPGTYIYTFTEKNITRKYIRILGLEPFINFIKETKTNGLMYDICEIYICNQGCSNGPGQILTKDLAYKNYKSSIKGFDGILDLTDRKFSKINIKKVNFQVEW